MVVEWDVGAMGGHGGGVGGGAMSDHGGQVGGGSNGWAWWSSRRWGQWVSMVVEWEVEQWAVMVVE
jgi:hypothetical protein